MDPSSYQNLPQKFHCCALQHGASRPGPPVAPQLPPRRRTGVAPSTSDHCPRHLGTRPGPAQLFDRRTLSTNSWCISVSEDSGRHPNWPLLCLRQTLGPLMQRPRRLAQNDVLGCCSSKPLPGPPNYPLRHPKYHLIESIRP